jgi:hypothetical protein
MQRVHARTVVVVPLTTAFIRFKLGSQRVLVFVFEWETLLPVKGPFSQYSQKRAMTQILLKRKSTDETTR